MTEEQRSQTAFGAKTLRAAGLSSAPLGCPHEPKWLKLARAARTAAALLGIFRPALTSLYRILLAMLLAGAMVARGGVAPEPESEQAALARKILDAYAKPEPGKVHKVLHVLYFTPSDRDPEPDYRERLQGVLEDIQSFYRDGMVRAGFGPETFDLPLDADGKLIIYTAKGKEPEDYFKRTGFQQNGDADNKSRAAIFNAFIPVFKAHGIDPDHDTVLIFCNLSQWDSKTRKFSHHSPYMGVWTQTAGLCFAVDSRLLDTASLTNKEVMLQDKEWGKESLGKFNTIFIGGIAHELGHAFSLPHCGERFDERARGRSLMGVGNHTYREELRGEGPGTFLTMASAMKLAGRPLFNHLDKETSLEPKLTECELEISTNVTLPNLVGTPGAVRLEGVVKGTPPIYGVIAYFDSEGDGGYHSPTATAVPDADGRFAIEINHLERTQHGDLTVQFCHVNGGVSERHLPFKISSGNEVDLQEAQVETALDPLVSSVLHGDQKSVREQLAGLEQGHAPGLAKAIGKKLAATVGAVPSLTPAEEPASVTGLSLGDAKALSAKVGWLVPAANRIPPNDQVASPLLDCGGLYATGLFAHAPSDYVFDLGGKWKTLRGVAGLQTAQQPYGSVEFIIKGDGRELYHSSVIRGADMARYHIKLSHVQKLELIVGDAGDGNHNDWGLWLDPMLER